MGVIGRAWRAAPHAATRRSQRRSTSAERPSNACLALAAGVGGGSALAWSLWIWKALAGP